MRASPVAGLEHFACWIIEPCVHARGCSPGACRGSYQDRNSSACFYAYSGPVFTTAVGRMHARAIEIIQYILRESILRPELNAAVLFPPLVLTRSRPWPVDAISYSSQASPAHCVTPLHSRTAPGPIVHGEKMYT
ncbi:hypothetical protein K458DRAFT_3574 [Lentithecium fluviatile CBS 122367]|uniref:Uncharacterized protein n=1 Tax=Lentithecium fluviatile CBS 122367 TaxID=1168545 RepID=A0A6G1JND4_9PLEO|nr:hypothetical protein K458DRAFT_3574 [Lentithecium fluviatile CBS 122367]